MRALGLIFAITFAGFAHADDFALRSGHSFERYGQAVMRDCEKGENLPLDQRPDGYCGHNYVVPYFTTQAEREPYRIVISEGQLHEAKSPHRAVDDGDYFFVMDGAGNFYFFTKDGKAPVHHSSFFSGEPIPAGGDVHVQDDHLTAIGYYTGHYIMNKRILGNAVDALKADGVDTDNLKDLGGHK